MSGLTDKKMRFSRKKEAKRVEVDAHEARIVDYFKGTSMNVSRAVSANVGLLTFCAHIGEMIPQALEHEH